jgi:BirA family biotin operon repressor/biotin-[acetyl-CoA-carboxylase] ligase
VGKASRCIADLLAGPAAGASRLVGLSLAVGTVLAESLHPDVRIKWPNDLWLQDRKLAGILIETANWSSGGVAQRYAVIGVGINLLPRDAEGLSTPPACLQDLWSEVQAPDALARLMPPLAQALRDFEQHGFAPFQTRFMARDALRDRAVALSDGTAGTAHGVAADGALLVHTLPAACRQVTSSEVSVRPTGKEGA